METKNEINKLVEMIQQEFGTVKGEIIKLDGRVDKLESKMDERFDEVLGREDKIFKRLDDLETDNTFGAGASRQQKDKLENHEERIVAIEEKLEIGETV